MRKITGKKDTDGYSDEDIRFGKIVVDFLPPPHLLVPKDDTVKVTLALSQRSFDFFKREAKKNKVPYQRMIRALLDHYVNHEKR